MNPAPHSLFQYLLRLGDNALVLGQRVSAWIGKGPALEEDLASANVALDLLGEARLWLTLAGETEGAGRDEDALAMRRDAHEFRNLLLVEQPNGDYAQTLTRQFLFDAWHHPLMLALAASNHPRIAEIAVRSAKEASYHLARSRDWMIRLGDGSDESHRRMQSALATLWPYTGELFEVDDIELELAAAGIAADARTLEPAWQITVRETLAEATLALPGEVFMQRGGRRGIHTEALSYLVGEMQYLRRTYPGCQW
jgi:ring-1,2-phenylacetyl-CoA epoxidase subunit PaaC